MNFSTDSAQTCAPGLVNVPEGGLASPQGGVRVLDQRDRTFDWNLVQCGWRLVG